jgi:hypothetical protein
MSFLPRIIEFVSLRFKLTLFSFFLGGLTFFGGASPLFATPDDSEQDTIEFINGDRLSGHLIKGSHGYVVFEGTLTGMLCVQWSNVKEIRLAHGELSIRKRSSDPAVLEYFSGATAAISTNNSDVTVTTDKETTQVALEQLQSAVPTTPSQTSFLQSWEGQLQSQSSVVVSTQHQYQLGGSLHLGRVTVAQTAFRHQATSVDLQASFGESKNASASPVKTELYEGILQHSVYITDRGEWRVFGLADFYHNLSLGMNFQQSYGAGIGRDWQYGSQLFGFATDVRFEGQYLYAPGHSENLGAIAVSQYYTVQILKIKNKPLSFAERTTFIPAFEDSHAFQARGLLKLTLPISPRFSIGLQESDDYLRNAPPASKQNYSNTQFTFTYIFGPLRNP